MLKYLNQYESEFEGELNKELMTKSWDRPLYEYIVDCWKSLEVVEYIHFKGYEWNPHMSEIDVNHHIFKREKGLKKKEKRDYKRSEYIGYVFFVLPVLLAAIIQMIFYGTTTIQIGFMFSLFMAFVIP